MTDFILCKSLLPAKYFLAVLLVRKSMSSFEGAAVVPIKLNRKVSSIILGLFISVAFGHAAVWAQTFPAGFLPSPKLEAYLEKVKKETRRELLIERIAKSLIGETASHWPHPTHVWVIIDPSLNVSDPDFERKIAHEVTHGLLFYARGYSRLASISTVPAIG